MNLGRGVEIYLTAMVSQKDAGLEDTGRGAVPLLSLNGKVSCLTFLITTQMSFSKPFLQYYIDQVKQLSKIINKNDKSTLKDKLFND